MSFLVWSRALRAFDLEQSVNSYGEKRIVQHPLTLPSNRETTLGLEGSIAQSLLST